MTSYPSPAVSLMGCGFIGGHYADLYPQGLVIEPRDNVAPQCEDVLYTRSTTSNYAPLKGDLHKDIDTNLTHLMKVLPNVRGRLCFLSSWFTYGSSWPKGVARAMRETDPCDPNGFYSATKLCGEHLLRSYTDTARAGLVGGPSSYQILRLSNVIGNDINAGPQKNAFEHLLFKVVNHQPVELYEGAGFRDYLHVEDACRAIHTVMTKGEPNTIYNVGRGESYALADLIEYAIDKVGSRSKVTRIPVPSFHQIVQVESFWMDTTKLRSLGFTPQYSIWESINKVLTGLMRERGDVLAEDRA